MWTIGWESKRVSNQIQGIWRAVHIMVISEYYTKSLIKSEFEKYIWSAFIGWKMTRWSSSTSSQRELQVSQTVKSEAQTYAIRFVSSRRRQPHPRAKFI